MDSMIVANTGLDVFCIALSLIPMIYLMNEQRLRQKLNWYFWGISVSNMFMIIGDLADWIIEAPSGADMKIVLSFFTMVYYISSGFVLYFFGRYMDAYLRFPKRMRKNFRIVLTLLCGVQIFFAATSPFTGAIYYVTENGYQRGSLFMVSQYIPLLCYLLFSFIILLYRKKLTRRELFFFLFYIFIPLAAGMTQMFFRGIAIVNVGVTLALLFIFVNIQSERDLLIKEQEKELGELHTDIMLSQIQPHFLYNTLTTIRQLCDIDPGLAKESIRDFAYFLRANMDSLTNKAPIPFGQELGHTEHYLKLEQQRFVGRLYVELDTPVTDFSIPPLSLQPLVENAVRHGIMMRDEGGTLTIRTDETIDNYLVIVSDDGVGFLPGTLTEDGNSHIGIENVRQRLQTMSNGTLKITSLPGQGTVATITIPKEGAL